QIVDDYADGQSEEAIQLAHPFRIAFGQIIVNSYDVNAASAERVEIDRKSGDQRFAFAGFHFRNHALVLHHAADELHIEVAHVEHAAAGLAHYGESLDYNLVQHFLQGVVLLFFELFSAVRIR